MLGWDIIERPENEQPESAGGDVDNSQGMSSADEVGQLAMVALFACLLVGRYQSPVLVTARHVAKLQPVSNFESREGIFHCRLPILGGTMLRLEVSSVHFASVGSDFHGDIDMGVWGIMAQISSPFHSDTSEFFSDGPRQPQLCTLYILDPPTSARLP